MDIKQIRDALQSLFDEMHSQQREKAAFAARQIRSNLTTEDLLNPDNFPEIINNPRFTYEDGIAAGILSSQMAVRALLNKL